MMFKGIQKLFLIISAILFLFSSVHADNAFERELVVKDQTRKTKVESVFKKLIQAYEDESASDFLDLVSDDRFRQDYITFTDALYSDIRKYDIHEVEYWIDKVVSDHVKQFLYVKWEKRFENIDDGRQGNQKGYSRFLFDEVNGKYLLVELAGNTLFGGSLKEWRDETPAISGAIKEVVKTPVEAECGPDALGTCSEINCETTGYGYWYNNRCNPTPQTVTPACNADNLNLCEESNCATAGGEWYNNTCNQNSEEAACTANGDYWYDGRCNTSPPLTCDQNNLTLCDETNCNSAGGGFWASGTCHGKEQDACTADGKFWLNNTCYDSEEAACMANGGYWYDGRCNTSPPGLPDLEITSFFSIRNNYQTHIDYTISYTVINNGPVETGASTDLQWEVDSGPTGSVTVPNLGPGEVFERQTRSDYDALSAEVDTRNQIKESNEGNNTQDAMPY